MHPATAANRANNGDDDKEKGAEASIMLFHTSSLRKRQANQIK